MISYSICTFLSDLLHLAQCPPSQSMLLHMARFHSFSWLHSISLCVFVWEPRGHRGVLSGWFCQVLMVLNERHWMLWVFNCSPESSKHWVTGAALMHLKLTCLGIKDADHISSLPWSLSRLLCVASPELIHPFSARMTNISPIPPPPLKAPSPDWCLLNIVSWVSF